MSTVSEDDFNRLVNFLYIVPVGLIDFDHTGAIHMANPKITQIFNPFCPTGMVTNLFEIIEPQFPEHVKRIKDFSEDSGTVIDNECITLMAPTSMDDSTPRQELILDLTVVKQPQGRFSASIHNVTEKAMLARENMVYNQTLDAISRSIVDYGMFSTDAEGIVNGWNENAQRLTGVDSAEAIGSPCFKVMGIDEAEADKLLTEAKTHGSISLKKDIEKTSELVLNVLKDPKGVVLGYSIICRFVSK